MIAKENLPLIGQHGLNSLSLLNEKGIINIGGKSQTIYDFAKKENPKIEKNYLKKIKKVFFPKDSSLNTAKLKNLIKKK